MHGPTSQDATKHTIIFYMNTIMSNFQLEKSDFSK
jgi:hypothetical protein